MNAEAQAQAPNETSEPAGAPVAEAAVDELAELKAALEAARQASAAARDAQLRGAAELDNVRKRTQRDIENAHRFALERFAGELLAVRDSLELAALNAASADAATLAAGQQATLQLLAAAFEKFSIQRIDPLGAAFDPSLHEAVAVQESATAAPDSVLQVLQSGYQLNGRLLRPARVIVARAPQAPA
ncbi:MAG: nucleotide exchange factor GrpE [Gammaproteobacteria bacterium]|nr:nucleotide exchange factor GrpE [Gammaproteobacteria bacterium]MDE2250911.1 nucleotide exchange factor GrpE [Gammaproteobacteria bacterium]